MAGRVYLVGAGPGDEQLITVKGLDKLKRADVIIYDYLSNPQLLNHCKATSEKIYVGKSAGNHTMSQEVINKLLVQHAQQGKEVVRLKGGDPYVFGRGGEEGLYLAHHQIHYEVIPGITSAIGGLAYGGIPITHREVASSFHVFTGHLKDDEKDLDWQTIARLEGTLVFLMGVKQLTYICHQLMHHGKDQKTPVGIIYRATTPEQKVLKGSLDTILELAKEAQVKAPSLIVVGKVVSLSSTLNWFESLPLFGQQIVVTRSREMASTLSQRLREEGAEAFEFPTIKTVPTKDSGLAQAIEQLEKYTYLILTSQTAVHLFFEGLSALGKDSRALAHLKVVAIGKTTEAVLRSYGISPDMVPKKATAEGVVLALENVLDPKDALLIPRSKQGRPYLIQALERYCKVEEIGLYETVPTDASAGALSEKLKTGQIRAVTFTSSTTVDYFIEALGEAYKQLLTSVELVSIGPITSERLRQYGFSVITEAEESTIDGLVKALIQ